MGLEIIDTLRQKGPITTTPQEYLNSKLSGAVNVLKPWNYSISIYNTPYCLDENLVPWRQKSYLIGKTHST